MKRTIILVAAFLILFFVNGCANQDGLVIWSTNDQLEEMINNYYRIVFPDIKFNYTIIPADQFPDKLDTVLKPGNKTPDIFALDASFVRKYVESGLLLDLTDIYERNKSKFLTYPVEIGTYNGRVYALSWQACPGAMFYRRSLARKYFGSDDPAFIQNLFSDFSKFLATAEIINRRSNGSCVIIPNRGDLFDVFLGARARPWMSDNGIHIDPAMELFMDMSKIMYDNRLDGRIGYKSENWYAGISGNLKDENGNPLEVFSYFLTTCDLNNAIKVTAPDSIGDWGMIPGPASFRLGGQWLGAFKDTENPEEVLQIIEWIVTNEDFLETWAKDKGDFVNNPDIINKMMETGYCPYLAGQNAYSIFFDYANKINGRLMQGTDWEIELLFREAVSDFERGVKTKAQALADFRSASQLMR